MKKLEVKVPSTLFVVIGPTGACKVRNVKGAAKRALRQCLREAQGTKYQGRYVLAEYQRIERTGATLQETKP